MSTIVVVRKGRQACIACDTLITFGSRKQRGDYVLAPDKVFQYKDTFIGTVGYAVHNAVLQSYFARYPQNVDLETPEAIFETWRRMHKVLEDEYHLNPRTETDDPYATTRMSALLASPRGIFSVTPSRDVEGFPRFWAIGSGTDYALAAMFTVYDRLDDVEEIARAGISAAAEFDDGTELPAIAHRIQLAEETP